MCVSLWVIRCEVTKQLSYGWGEVRKGRDGGINVLEN
jgi:hypothetical protein